MEQLLVQTLSPQRRAPALPVRVLPRLPAGRQVTTWLEKHPRFHLHFTPTSASWLNLVERWFAEITRQRIRRGVLPSVPELAAAIEDYIRVNNPEPRPFVWTKNVDTILD